MSTFRKMLEFVKRLESQRLFYRMSHARDDAIMIELAVPGERWEVEFFENGTIEVEVFVSRSGVEEEASLQEFWQRFGER